MTGVALVEGEATPPTKAGPGTLADQGGVVIAAVAVWYFGKLVGAVQRLTEDARRWLADEATLKASAIEHHRRVAEAIASQSRQHAEVVHLLSKDRAQA